MELSDREKCIFLIENDQLRVSDAIIILEGDGDNRVRLGCDLFNQAFAPNLVFSGGSENLEYGSFPFHMLKEKFLEYNVNPDNIFVESNSQHTRQQAEEIIQLCIDRKWGKIIIVASHYHQLRASLTLLKVLLERNLERHIKIFNAPVKDLKWFSTTPWGRRIELLEQEFDRINRYLIKGHLATFDELIKYQEWKEK